jgi:hypothetical protein
VAAVQDLTAQRYAVAAVRDAAAQRSAVRDVGAPRCEVAAERDAAAQRSAARDVGAPRCGVAAERRCAARDVGAQRRAAALAWGVLRDAEQVLRAAAGLVSSVPVKTRLSSARAKQQSEVMRRREP